MKLFVKNDILYIIIIDVVFTKRGNDGMLVIKVSKHINKLFSENYITHISLIRKRKKNKNKCKQNERQQFFELTFHEKYCHTVSERNKFRDIVNWKLQRDLR